jgi:hypothetical protein
MVAGSLGPVGRAVRGDRLKRAATWIRWFRGTSPAAGLRMAVTRRGGSARWPAPAPSAPDRADDDHVVRLVDGIVNVLLRPGQQDPPDGLAVDRAVACAHGTSWRHRGERAHHVLELLLERGLGPRPMLPPPRRDDPRSLQSARGQGNSHRLDRRSVIASARSINWPACSSAKEASSSRCNAARSSSSRSSPPRASTSLSRTSSTTSPSGKSVGTSSTSRPFLT